MKTSSKAKGCVKDLFSPKYYSTVEKVQANEEGGGGGGGVDEKIHHQTQIDF